MLKSLSGALKEKNGVVFNYLLTRRLDIKGIKQVEMPQTKRNTQGLPPDGGYGWVVAIAASFSHLLLVGFSRCLGFIHLALLSKYEQSESETAWASAIFNTCRTLTAPLCALLVDRFGSRVMAMAGALLMFMGLFLSAFATNLYQLYITFGVLTGVGGAMAFTTDYIMIGHYFSRNKGKAMGITMMGCGIGNVVFAHVTNNVLHMYGYFGGMLIFAAIQLNHAISGALYRPVEQCEIKITQELAEDQFLASNCQMSGNKLTSSECLTIGNKQTHSELIGQKCLSTEDNRINKEINFNNRCVENVKADYKFSSSGDVHTNNRHTDEGFNKATPHIGLSAQQVARIRLESVGPSYTPVQTNGSYLSLDHQRIKKSFSPAGSFNSLVLGLSRECIQIGGSQKTIKSMDSKPEQDYSVNANSKLGKNKKKKRFLCSLSSKMLLCNITFHLHGLVIMGYQVVIMTFLIFLPGFAQEHGHTDHQIAFLVSSFGIGDMLGCILSGYLFDLKIMRTKRIYLFGVVAFLFGFSSLMMAAMSSLVSMCIVSTLTGFFQGATNSQRITVVSDFVPPSQLSFAVGLVLFFQGLGNIYGPPIAGLIRDATGTSTYCFVFCGAFMVVGSSLFLIQNVICAFCCNSKNLTFA